MQEAEAAINTPIDAVDSVTEYESIAEPLSLGAIHVTVASAFPPDTEGLAGVDGIEGSEMALLAKRIGSTITPLALPSSSPGPPSTIVRETF